METKKLSFGITSLVGLILTMPTAYVIFISVLKYSFGWDYLFDAAAPELERWGIKDPPGLNINLLILCGPVLALLLNVLTVLHIEFETTAERIDCRLSIAKNRKNLAVVFFSSTVLVILFWYLFVENCNSF